MVQTTHTIHKQTPHLHVQTQVTCPHFLITIIFIHISTLCLHFFPCPHFLNINSMFTHCLLVNTLFTHPHFLHTSTLCSHIHTPFIHTPFTHPHLVHTSTLFLHIHTPFTHEVLFKHPLYKNGHTIHTSFTLPLSV